MGSRGPSRLGVVEDAVQAGVLAADRVIQGRDRVFAGVKKVRRDHYRTGFGPCHDLVEHRVELLLRATEQHHVRTVLSVGERRRPADAVAGARDQDHAVVGRPGRAGSRAQPEILRACSM